MNRDYRGFPEELMARFYNIHAIKPPSPMRAVAWMVSIGMILMILALIFVPWVQTAYGYGYVTALNPQDRPQPINALVSGRIKKWYVQDGSTVKAGDPLLELVDNDVDFILRLEEKRDSLARNLESARLVALTAESDLNRQKSLFKEGLSSEKSYELAKIKHNKAQAEVAKAEAELNRAQVSLAQQDLQIIRAPRDGIIIEIMAGDTATTIKAGDRIAKMTPTSVLPAVELYIDGNDIPLISINRKVRLQFEGWPVVQFSGWPSRAIGTFGGLVYSIDPSVSANGRFRVMVVPDPEDEPWPGEHFLRMGAKVKGWVLLETVKLGFELWRNLNNFPPILPIENINTMREEP
jgi:RND family efflux transporter MFP subunit